MGFIRASRRARGLALAVALVAGCAPVGPGPRETAAPTQVPLAAANGRYADVNGTRLYYEVAGPATGAETIVLLHQFTLDARMWDDQIAPFARRYRVLRYDARGFGRSAPIQGSYTVRDDLRALLDQLGIARAHVVGLSMGARYAAEFALAYPARVQTLVLADPTVTGMRFSGAFTREFALADAAARSGDVAEAKRRWLGSSLFAATRDKPSVMKRVREIVSGYSGWHFAHTDVASPVTPPAVQQLARLRMPILVVVGDNTLADVQGFADRIAREAPNARRVVIKDAGHLVNMEAPAAFNRTVLDFLAKPSTPAEAPPAADRARPAETAPCVDPRTKRPVPCT